MRCPGHKAHARNGNELQPANSAQRQALCIKGCTHLPKLAVKQRRLTLALLGANTPTCPSLLWPRLGQLSPRNATPQAGTRQHTGDYYVDTCLHAELTLTLVG